MLLDCLVYCGLLFLVAGLGYAAFYRGWESSASLKRNAEQIARAVNTGERWREDVRRATGALKLEESAGETVLHLPCGPGEVTYRIAQGVVWRRANEGGSWSEVLDRVKVSQMQAEARQKVTAWKWEVELKTREQKRRVALRFTFEAVPRGNKNE